MSASSRGESESTQVAGAVNGKTEPHLRANVRPRSASTLHLIERIARREKVCVQVGVAGRLKSEIADLVCRFERATQQIAASRTCLVQNMSKLPKLKKVLAWKRFSPRFSTKS